MQTYIARTKNLEESMQWRTTTMNVELEGKMCRKLKVG
jgi:hypothetical protein